MRTKRFSNIELLRILAIVMIITYHITLHGIRPQLIDETIAQRMDNGLFNHPFFYKRLLILDLLMPMGHIGNNIFILISGYFMSKKEKINFIKISKKILTQVIFATIFLVITSTIVYRIFIRSSSRYVQLIPGSIIYSDWWFCGYYFSVMLIGGLFLNRFLARLDKTHYLEFLLILLAIIQLNWAGALLDKLADNLRILALGVFLYSLGGFISKFDPFKKIRAAFLFFAMLACCVIQILTSYNTTITRINNYKLEGSTEAYIQTVNVPKIYSIWLIVVVIALFEIFKRLKMPYISIINKVSASTLMIYLIHENKFFQSLYSEIDFVRVLYYHPAQFLLMTLKWVLLGFGFGIVGYGLYCLLERWMSSGIVRRLLFTSETHEC